MDQPQSTAAANPPEGPKSEGPRKPSRRWRWWMVAGLILLVALGGLFLHWRQPKAQSSPRGRAGATPPPLMVSTATARQGDIGVYVSGLGVVTPLNTVAVKSRVD